MLIASLTAGSLTTSLRAAAFTNGDFESPAIATNSVVDRVDGTTVGSWTAVVPGGTNAAIVNGFVTPYDGNQTYGFNGGQSAVGAAIYQDFSTFVGTPYAVTFHVSRAGNGGGASAVRSTATPTGSAAVLGTVYGGAVTPKYVTYAFNFTATSSSTRLTLLDASTETFSVDPILDGISVVAVPEPATAAVFGIAGATSLLRRRRTR